MDQTFVPAKPPIGGSAGEVVLADEHVLIRYRSLEAPMVIPLRQVSAAVRLPERMMED